MSNAKVTLTWPVLMYLRFLLPWVAVSSPGVVEAGPYYSSCNCCSSWAALLFQDTKCIKCSACYSLYKIRLQGNWPSQDWLNWTKFLPASQQYKRHTTVSNICNFTLYYSIGRLHIYCCWQQKSFTTYKKIVLLSLSPLTHHAKPCAEAVMKIVWQKQGRQRESPCYEYVMLRSSV